MAILDDLSTEALKLIVLIAVIFLVYVIQRVVQYLLSRAVRRNPAIALDDVINGVRVLTRLGAGLIVLYTILFLFELHPNIILGISTLIAAIVTFSTVESVQNFVAGLFILITRPFGVRDLISIDDQEGVVTEISLNFTKLKTLDNTYTYIPNKNIIKAKITNYSRKISKKIDTSTKLRSLKSLKGIFVGDKIVRYSFQWGVPLGNLKVAKEKITDVCKRYEPKFGYQPDFFLWTISHRMEFKFIVITDDAEKIIDHLTDFRDEIIMSFH
jgi:hypothetical protein